jgi:hypothetical protein
MFELILKVSLAHLLGDFIFQTNKMVDDIDAKKLRAKSLYLHAAIHLVLLLAITGFEKQFVIPALVLSALHLGIDMITKVWTKNKINGVYNLLLDQSLHCITIALFVRNFYIYTIDFKLIFSTQNYLMLAALVSVTYVSGIIMKKVMELFNYPLPNDGIKDAGRYIGMLERLFIFAFIITSFWEGIGFLLAAKSIFRFGDLKEHKEIKLTEYILIGTLLSFGIAILVSEIYLHLKSFAGS